MPNNITPAALAERLRKRLPEVLVITGTNWVDLYEGSFQLSVRCSEGQWIVDSIRAYIRADRALARIVMDCLDELEGE